MVRSTRSISQQTCRQSCSREPLFPGMWWPADLLQVPPVYHFCCIQLTVLVLESYACQDHGSNSSLSRQYSGYHDGLRDLKFNYAPDNRISAGRINNCIDVRIFLMSYIYGISSDCPSQVTRLWKITRSKSCTAFDYRSSDHALWRK